MNRHVFNTWLLGHGSYVYVIILIDIIRKDRGTINEGGFEYLFYLDQVLLNPALVCLSLPSLFLSRYAIKKIMLIEGTIQGKFLSWLSAATVIVLLQAGLALLLWQKPDVILAIFSPALAITLLTVLLRYKQFVKMMESIKLIPVKY